MMLSVLIDLAFAEPNDVVVIEKPKWCNSANLSYYYNSGELQENTIFHVLPYVKICNL